MIHSLIKMIFVLTFLSSIFSCNEVPFKNEVKSITTANKALSFSQRLQPVPAQAKFIDPDYFIWGGSMVEGDDGKYHLFYSRWEKKHGHNAWLTRSEIAHAIADSPTGPYVHVEVVLPIRDPKYWDGGTTHNPTIHKFGDKYYLYYMGNTGDGKVIKGFNWTHRNNQRIGVAIADNPNGPWQRFNKPLIDVSEDENAYDALLVSNPSIAQRSDGSFIMVYKSVAKHNKLPSGGPVVHLVATSKHPDKDFVKHPDPVFTMPGEKFPAEDPFIWVQGDKLFAIVKDMHGAFTNKGQALVMFESNNGIDWDLADNPLVSTLQINWENKGVEKVAHLERPQLWLKEGKPSVLFCAVDIDRGHSFNVHIPLNTD